MKKRLQTFCGDFEQAPERYEVSEEDQLKQMYTDLQLRDTSELRLAVLCTDALETPTESGQMETEAGDGN